MIQTASIGPSATASATGALAFFGFIPSAVTAASACAVASSSASAAFIAPLAAPATWTIAPPSWFSGGRAGSGRKQALTVSQVSLPPQWLHRCTTGDQPPDMATASQAISSITAPSPACRQMATEVTRLPPFTLATPRPASIRSPRLFAFATRSPDGLARASTMAGTASPASFKAIAVR